jgi:hypothetical protein
MRADCCGARILPPERFEYQEHPEAKSVAPDGKIRPARTPRARLPLTRAPANITNW